MSGWPKMSALERFESKTIKTPGGCWWFVGWHDRDGYGHFSYEGRMRKAHRISLILHTNQDPGELQVDHLCRRRGCVNPLHLDIVTPRTNTLRGMGVSGDRARQTECIRGHAFTPENTYLNDRRRYCRTCRLERLGSITQCPDCGTSITTRHLGRHRAQVHKIGATR